MKWFLVISVAFLFSGYLYSEENGLWAIEIENHYKIGKPQMKELNIKRETMNGKFVYRGNKPILILNKLKVEFTPKGAWTIRRVSYAGNEILSPTGAFGTVVSGWVDKDGVKHGWTGTGHGGEIVESLILMADAEKYVLIADKKEIGLKNGFEVIARKFSLEKRSELGPYIHEAILTFEGETIQEDFKFKVEGDDSTVNFIYAFMHCFTNFTDSWVTGLKDGIRKGKFKDDKSFTLQEDIRWAGIYSEKLETGIAYIYPEIYKGKNSFKNSFWNRAYDNKLYLMPLIPSGKGKHFGFQVTLWFCKVGEKDWHEKLEKILEKFNIKVEIPKNLGDDR